LPIPQQFVGIHEIGLTGDFDTHFRLFRKGKWHAMSSPGICMTNFNKLFVAGRGREISPGSSMLFWDYNALDASPRTAVVTRVNV